MESKAPTTQWQERLEQVRKDFQQAAESALRGVLQSFQGRINELEDQLEQQRQIRPDHLDITADFAQSLSAIKKELRLAREERERLQCEIRHQQQQAAAMEHQEHYKQLQEIERHLQEEKQMHKNLQPEKQEQQQLTDTMQRHTRQRSLPPLHRFPVGDDCNFITSDENCFLDPHDEWETQTTAATPGSMDAFNNSHPRRACRTAVPPTAASKMPSARLRSRVTATPTAGMIFQDLKEALSEWENHQGMYSAGAVEQIIQLRSSNEQNGRLFLSMLATLNAMKANDSLCEDDRRFLAVCGQEAEECFDLLMQLQTKLAEIRLPASSTSAKFYLWKRFQVIRKQLMSKLDDTALLVRKIVEEPAPSLVR